jgi:hypothetical protein
VIDLYASERRTLAIRPLAIGALLTTPIVLALLIAAMAILP